MPKSTRPLHPKNKFFSKILIKQIINNHIYFQFLNNKASTNQIGKYHLNLNYKISFLCNIYIKNLRNKIYHVKHHLRISRSHRIIMILNIL